MRKRSEWELRKCMKTTIVVVILSAVLLSCAKSSRVEIVTEVPSGNPSVEFKRIYFQEGRPRRSESADSVIDQEQTEVLRGLLEALQANPRIGAEIMGFADKQECLASDCHDLSLRRAKIVFDWFLNHGIPAAHLKGPLGESVDWPLDSGETVKGRALNRRVQLEPFVVSSKAGK
jgi:hypothetical protein